jgi:EF-P beta-lysylation protein EpmB
MPANWQSELAAFLPDSADPRDFLRLDAARLPDAEAAASLFPLRLTRAWAERIQPGNPADPLLRQVWPAPEELDSPSGYAADPVGDHEAQLLPGLLRKYHGRALLVTTGACAIHCRYCFRRAYPYSEGQLSREREQAALELIAGDPGLEEIILSGGDPLMLHDARLKSLIDRLAAIPHIRRLRLHTRLPVALPSRVTPELAGLLASIRPRVVMVIHANHPHEIDAAVGSALSRLRQSGVTLLNQSVLLRGVNDDAKTLALLSETLFEHGVLPYYLHLLDKARGTAHFDVPEEEARRLQAALRARLPGYLVPRLVRELAGEPCKVPLELLP